MDKKILLIEDNPDMRDNTAEILELASYDVATAENGKVGVEKARTFNPDLIISDIMMPELDGYGVLFMLSKNPETASIPFIFLTAKADKEDFRKGMNQGADDYLTKPFEEMELLNAIESRLKKSEAFRSQVINDKASLNNFLESAGGILKLEEMAKNRKEKEFKKKDMIYLEGSYPNVLYFINQGKVKTFKTNEDGKELINSVYNEGSFFGFTSLMQNEAYNDSAMAMEDTKVSLIPKDDFNKLLYEHRDLANKFIQMLSNSIKEKEERLLHLAYNSVRKRVAESLLGFYDKYKDTNGDELPVSRDDIAKVVGTSTETVIRTLGEFKEEGLITTAGRRIKMLDVNGLENLKF